MPDDQRVSARYLPQRDYDTVKAATRRLVRRAGGCKQAAETTRVDPARLSRYGATHEPQFAPVDVIADLEAEAGEPVMTRALAALSGFALVRLPEAGEPVSWPAALGGAVKEAGEALSAIGRAVADGGTVTLEESRELGLRTEIAEALQKLVQLDAQLASLEADGEG